MLVLCTISIISGCGSKDNDSPATNLTGTDLTQKAKENAVYYSKITTSAGYFYYIVSSNSTNSNLSNYKSNLMRLNNEQYSDEINWSSNADNNGWYTATLDDGAVLKLRHFPKSNKTELTAIVDAQTLSIIITKKQNGLCDGIISFSSKSDENSLNAKLTASLFDSNNGCGVFDYNVTVTINNTPNSRQLHHLEATFDQKAPSAEKPIKLTGWFYKDNIKETINTPIYSAIPNFDSNSIIN